MSCTAQRKPFETLLEYLETIGRWVHNRFA